MILNRRYNQPSKTYRFFALMRLLEHSYVIAADAGIHGLPLPRERLLSTQPHKKGAWNCTLLEPY